MAEIKISPRLHEAIDVAPAEAPLARVEPSPDLHRMMEQSAMVSMIERVALDPNASIEKLERMLAMKERLDLQAREERDREAEQAYYRAMAACQSNLKVVTRNRENTHTRSHYADLAALANSADPIIHEHGFTTSYQPAGTAENGDLLIQWTIAHTAGHVKTGIAAFPPDKAGSQGTANKTPIQAQGSTFSYGRRYLKMMHFDIATGDDTDGNAGATSTTITGDQFLDLQRALDGAGIPAGDLLKIYGAEHLEELPAANYGPALALIKQRAAKKAKEAAA